MAIRAPCVVDFSGTYDGLNGTLIVTVLSNGLTLFYQLDARSPIVFGASRVTFVPVYIGPQVNYPQTPAEMQAAVLPSSFNCPELDTHCTGFKVYGRVRSIPVASMRSISRRARISICHSIAGAQAATATCIYGRLRGG